MNLPAPSPTHRFALRYLLAGSGGVIIAGLVVFAVWHHSNHGKSPSLSSTPPVAATVRVAATVTHNPAESFDTLRTIVETGGNNLKREAAVAWLDRTMRQGRQLDAEKESYLLHMLEQGGNRSWSTGYRESLFNSAFNVLRLSNDIQPFACILQKLAVCDPDKILRLYALQHIRLLRTDGRLIGPLAAEIQTTLEGFADSHGDEVSGLALATLIDWDAPNSAAHGDLLKQAVAMAADPSRPLEIRITAIHAAGSAGLELDRTLAHDIKQPVMLRKAAIARIGHHGDAEDVSSLEALCKQSSRIAQAAEPALKALRARLANPSAPAPVHLSF